MSLVIPQSFQHILRVMNTNIDGKRNVMFAITAIKGIGRRYANLVLKKVSLTFTTLCFVVSSIKSTTNYISREFVDRHLEVEQPS